MDDFLKQYMQWWQVVFYVFCLVTLIQLLYYWLLYNRAASYKPAGKVQSQTHPVSMVICARDEAANLAKNLPGVLVQTYPSTHEVIVVNHNSQDETRYLLEELKKTFKQLQVVNLEQEAKGIPGKKYPLSIGIKEAKHEIILLTDADCVPATEHWLMKMQDAYHNGVEVVLGYGAYYKRPGLLNKLIRFETFHTALNYFSLALAGLPYMGVGRNLSYKKGLFLRNKGFSSINHVMSGDDDLFINQVANKNNTGIVMDPEAFTLAEPKKTFNEWVQQKNRHYTTGKFYKPIHKFLLGTQSLTHALFYPLLIISIITYDWRIAVGMFAIRSISQAVVYYKAMQKLDEKDLFSWYWLFDIWMFVYYCIFAPALWRRPKKNWN
jgi:glycosyltransferase involved in cell wall biosynthesis